MRRRDTFRRTLSGMLSAMLMFVSLTGAPLPAQAAVAGQTIVLTLGADLSDEQKQYIMEYFGITADQVQIVTITNADERAQLGDLIPLEQIGTRTVSCALVNPTTSGGIQVKTANMNYVTGNMIASTLVTSGVTNCEVLTAAPFEVSGTGALTGVIMAYETASGETLDEDKKDLANEELVTTGEVAETVGQDTATLIVNDIKIHIVRDSITDQQQVNEVVDEVIDTTQNAAAQAARQSGTAAPAQLGTEDHEKLYQFGYKVGQMNYNYAQMQVTLERVTRNVTKATGIDDPITDTFTTTEADDALASDSILLQTQDSVLGDDATVSSTTSVALGDHPAEELDVYTGDVRLTQAGGVKAERFVNHTNLVPYRDLNGSYSLMDLNGNVVTEPIYDRNFSGTRYGMIEASLSDGSGMKTVLDANGTVVVPPVYAKVETLSSVWAAGVNLTQATQENYQYTDYEGNYYNAASFDLYNTYSPGTLVMTVGGDGVDRYSFDSFQDYLSFQGTDGTVTIYDVTGTAVATADSLYDFSAVNADGNLSSTLSDATGYYVGRLQGNYLSFTDPSTGLKGILDRYGNVIIPARLDHVYTSFIDSTYEAGGYFSGEKDGHFQYLTSGGTVTGDFPYSWSEDSLNNYGMGTRVTGEDGSYILLSGDGAQTDLGTKYSYLACLEETSGLLWVGSTDEGDDLIDWHGNVLIEGADEVSVSANGHYVIAQDGYTSSTLYLVDDAAPVSISETAGGASEVQVETEAGVSLDAFSGDVTLQDLGTVNGSSFMSGTDLVCVEGESGNYALYDLAGNQVTDDLYLPYGTAHEGWLILADNTTGLYGLFTRSGLQAFPCQYDFVSILGEHWAVGYHLVSGGTENDYDFRDGSFYYLIDSADVYHLEPDTVEGVTLTRDQLGDVQADGEYLNIQDRTTGTVTTYDSSFQAIASVSSIYDFSDYSAEEVRRRQLQDQTGYYISDFVDGYAVAIDNSRESANEGIVDTSGNVIVPLEYDRFDSSENAAGEFTFVSNGYFCAVKDDMMGYVTAGGTVSCELKYDYDMYHNCGASMIANMDDGTSSLVSADGVESSGYDMLLSTNGGLLWINYDYTSHRYSLIDWHGQELLSGFDYAEVSDDGKYAIISESDGTYRLYGVNGATIADAVSNGPADSSAQEAASEAASELTQTETETSGQTETSPSTETAPETQTQTETSPSAETMPETQAHTQTETSPSTETMPETRAQTQAETSPSTETAEQGQTQTSSDTSAAVRTIIDSALRLIDTDLETNRSAASALLTSAQTLLTSLNPDAAAIVGSAVTLLDAGTTDTASVAALLTAAEEML